MTARHSDKLTEKAALGSMAGKAKAHRQSRRLLPVIGALVVLSLIVAGLWPRPIPVETAEASTGPLRSSVNEEGKTRIRERYVVSAPIPGQLRRIELKAGDKTEANTSVVAVIDPLPPSPLDARARSLAEARKDTANANLEKAKKAHEFAGKELARFQDLYAQKTISVQEFENMQWRETSAAKELSAAESALRQTEAELAEFDGRSEPKRPPVEVKSPISGAVLRVLQESARAVAAGTPLVELGDPANLEVVIDVLSRDGAAIAPGTRVELDQWGGEKPLQARVRLVEPAAFTKISALGVEEQRVNVVADIVTPPADRRNLGDNFRVEARIITWETDQALKVPAGALFRRGQQWAVFALEEDHARLRTVTPGRSSGSETQIVEGLKAGDRVILYPGSRVEPGARVRPIKI